MLKKLLHRLIQSAHLPTLVLACNTARDLLQRDFGDVMRRRLDVCAREAGLAGSLRGDERERREREARDAFIVRVADT